MDDEILNRSCLDWLERTGNAKVHGTTKKIPAEVFKEEREYLRPLVTVDQKRSPYILITSGRAIPSFTTATGIPSLWELTIPIQKSGWKLRMGIREFSQCLEVFSVNTESVPAEACSSRIRVIYGTEPLRWMNFSTAWMNSWTTMQQNFYSGSGPVCQRPVSAITVPSGQIWHRADAGCYLILHGQ